MTLKKKSNLFIFIILIFLTFLAGCASRKIKGDVTPEERLEAAIKWFNDGFYLDAKPQFRIIILGHPGSRIVDQAQYYYAECHYQLKEYILAAAEYERLIKVFPNSEYVDDAQFKIGLCYFELSPNYSLEQEYTLKAINSFQQFLEDYPNSELVPDVEKKMFECRMKLAKKKYAAAENYRKIGYLSSAIIYYNLVLESYYDTPFAPKAQYWVAECYRKKGELEKAKEEFDMFVNKYPQHDFVNKAQEKLAEIKKSL